MCIATARVIKEEENNASRGSLDRDNPAIVDLFFNSGGFCKMLLICGKVCVRKPSKPISTLGFKRLCNEINKNFYKYTTSDAKAAFDSLNGDSKKFVIFLCHYYFIVQVYGRKSGVGVDFDLLGVAEVGALSILYAGGYLSTKNPLGSLINKDSNLDLVVRTVISPRPANFFRPEFLDCDKIIDDIIYKIFPY